MTVVLPTPECVPAITTRGGRVPKDGRADDRITVTLPHVGWRALRGATVEAMCADAPIPPVVRGWCPTAHAPMETGDGWIVRARIGCRSVLADQWAELADVAATCGNGLVEFTVRGNVQVRGIPEQLTNDVARRLAAVGLAGLDEADDRRRAVVVNPLTRLAPATGAAVTVGEVTACLEDQLARHGGELPPKWWAVVDADVAWPMPIAGCDIAVQQRLGVWRVLVAGHEVWAGLDPRLQAARIVERCAHLGRRARDLEPEGEPSVATTSGRAAPESRGPWRGVRRMDGLVVAAVAPSFGVAVSPALCALATVAATHDVSVHPTPDRGVAVIAPERCAAEVDRCLGDLHGHGWITVDDDPRQWVSACIGSRGCASALVDTWHVAADLIGAAGAQRLHVSGCSKRCGAPAGARELVATGIGIAEVVASGIDDR